MMLFSLTTFLETIKCLEILALVTLQFAVDVDEVFHRYQFLV